MISKQREIGKPCNRCAARMLGFVGFVLLLGLLAVLFASFAYSSAPDTCIEGYVWREAYPDDHVCVTPDVRKQAAADNQFADSPGFPAWAPSCSGPAHSTAGSAGAPPAS